MDNLNPKQREQLERQIKENEKDSFLLLFGTFITANVITILYVDPSKYMIAVFPFNILGYVLYVLGACLLTGIPFLVLHALYDAYSARFKYSELWDKNKKWFQAALALAILLIGFLFAYIKY